MKLYKLIPLIIIAFIFFGCSDSSHLQLEDSTTASFEQAPIKWFYYCEARPNRLLWGRVISRELPIDNGIRAQMIYEQGSRYFNGLSRTELRPSLYITIKDRLSRDVWSLEKLFIVMTNWGELVVSYTTGRISLAYESRTFNDFFTRNRFVINVSPIFDDHHILDKDNYELDFDLSGFKKEVDDMKDKCLLL